MNSYSISMLKKKKYIYTAEKKLELKKIININDVNIYSKRAENKIKTTVYNAI